MRTTSILPSAPVSSKPLDAMATSPASRHSGRDSGGNARGQNINHLLAFTLPPRSRPPAAAPRRSRRAGGGVPFNKERYVNAQYRFIVKPTSDYTVFFADADLYLNWTDILAVLIPSSSALSTASPSSSHAAEAAAHEGASCPICLCPPTAPRMTKCGHVFCYACILHYLAIDDERKAAAPVPHQPPGAAPSRQQQQQAGHRNPAAAPIALAPPSNRWKKCPICWDAVYARDLKAVHWSDARAIAEAHEREEAARAAKQAAAASTSSTPSSPVTRPSSSDLVSLRLIERPHHTTLALPQSSTWPHATTLSSGTTESVPLIPQHSAPWHFQPDVKSFAKFMLATPEMLLEHLAQDASQLEVEKAMLGADELGLGFVELAERKVREQMARVVDELDTPAVRSAMGQARNDLREHGEEEAGRMRRATEATSRRQRRKKVRDAETAIKASGEDAVASVGGEDIAAAAPAPDSQAPSTSDVEASQAEVADWLAIRSRTQGGAVASQSASGTATPTANVPVEGGEAENGSTKPSQPAPGPTKARRNINPPPPSSSSYLFYQAASGQHIYLHPLDIKILLSEYGSYASFPRSLRLKIGGADEGSMNEELRRRCKYLSHLPQGTDVVFVEPDWMGMVQEAEKEGSKPVVSRATLRPYEAGLKQRRNKRKDKERREERARIRAEEREGGASGNGGGSGASNGAAVGGGGRGAERRREALQASLADDPELGSLTSSSAGGNAGGAAFLASSLGSNAASASAHSNASHGATQGPGQSHGHSPSFREAALWGAEREFPIHPGAEAIEEFPAVSSAQRASTTMTTAAARSERSHGAIDIPPMNSASASSVTAGSRQRTVWGTAAPSFASALHASSRRDGFSTEEDGTWHLHSDRELGSGPGSGLGSGSNVVDADWDAFWELEESYLGGSGKKLTPPAGKEGRGLNRLRGKGVGGGAPGGSAKASLTTTPNGVGRGSGGGGGANANANGAWEAGAPGSGSHTPRTTAGSGADLVEGGEPTSLQKPQQQQQGRRKPKKLILTSSGRGTD